MSLVRDGVVGRPRIISRRGRRSWSRWGWLVVLLMLAPAGLVAAEAGVHPAAAPGGMSVGAAGVAYAPPLAGRLRVLRPFEPPPTPYSAGHRGVDLQAPPGAMVLAAGAGQISFAGRVAGRGVVVITHPDGIRTEYEPVAPLVAGGQTVARGQPIARIRGQHDDWLPQRCLHWGARRGDTYLDPLSLLRPLGPVRLLPWTR